MTAAALAVAGVRVRFGGVTVLDAVDLQADAGVVTGLIGPNGAGKTTLFNVVCGLLAPAAGVVMLAGEDVTGLPPHRRARRGLARTFQRLELFGLLTAHGNVRVAAAARHRRPAAHDPDGRATALLDRVGAGHLSGERADRLPTGQARLVELARALATDPAVLLLDEPASGLDQTETAALVPLLRALAAEGIAVVLVEHDMSLVMQVSDVVHVLDVGRMIAVGPPAAIRRDERVLAAYLGGGEVAGSTPVEVDPSAGPG